LHFGSGLGPLQLLFFVDVRFLTADLEGYLGLFSNFFKNFGSRPPKIAP
jgi:hypothetical protein